MGFPYCPVKLTISAYDDGFIFLCIEDENDNHTEIGIHTSMIEVITNALNQAKLIVQSNRELVKRNVSQSAKDQTQEIESQSCPA
jgi:hypothetical protein